MHVLHVIDGLGLGGAERMLVDIANRTVADGGTASVCVTRNATARVPELDPSIGVLILDRKGKFSPVESIRLLRWIRASRIDVIHAHMRSSTAFVVLLRASRLLRTPIVFHDHYGGIEIDTSVPRWFRLGRRYISYYVGVHQKLCEWARGAGMPASHTEMIPNGVDLARFSAAKPTSLREELGIGADIPLGLLVATVRRDKGIEVLLEAVAASRSRHHVRIAIAGTHTDADYLAECRERCTRLGLDGIVTFLGPRDDVPGLLQEADFALLSSHSESGPLVLLEYFAAGLPIVSTLVGDIGRRFAELGVPGFVAPGNIAAYTTELDRLLAMTAAQRRARGEIGKAHLSKHWDIRAAMPRWYEIYRKVCGQ